MPASLAFLHGGDGGVGAGIVEDDRLGAAAIAVSISSDCLLASSSCTSTSAS